MAKSKAKPEGSKNLLAMFETEFEPLEVGAITLLTDHRTGAEFCECHVKGSKLIELGTVDVPLDPDEQAEFRANREVVEDAYAFQKIMKDDARQRRTFSNIVTEYNKDFDEGRPIKIIGGQHRFEAIKEALDGGVDEFHGIKVYFGLDMEQRLDVQLISNTNIDTSSDLFDRMHETVAGPELRQWCHEVGLLPQGKDFADRRVRGGPITVQIARTFIINYFRGAALVGGNDLDEVETLPVLSPSGRFDPEWEKIRSAQSTWSDAGLKKAGKEFARLLENQRKAFQKTKGKVPPDFPEKAMNMAVMAAWAFVAGLLNKNSVRLKRHFSLADSKGKDPLNARALASGRHKTDAENYRGLGYRTDAKERGRFVELFLLQAEDQSGITPNSVDAAIKKYHAKLAHLDYLKAKKKGA